MTILSRLLEVPVRRNSRWLSCSIGMVLIFGLAAGCGWTSDLSSGRIILEFAVESDSNGTAPTDSDLEHAAEVLRRRLNPDGTHEVAVKLVGGNIEVSVPGHADADRDRTVSQVNRAGTFELALLANPFDHPDVVAQAQATASDIDLVVIDGETVASWRAPASAHTDVARGLDPNVSCVKRDVDRGGTTVTQLLLIRHADDERVTDENVESARLEVGTNDEEMIGITFDANGGERMRRLTSRNLPTADGRRRHLAIVFDDEVHSAPAILDQVSTQCQISGGYTHVELVDLVAALGSGELGIDLNPIPVRETRFAPDGSPLP
jgi:preprotein translocase subunit SecD